MVAAAGKSLWVWVPLGLRDGSQGEHGIPAPLAPPHPKVTETGRAQLSPRVTQPFLQIPLSCFSWGEISSAHGEIREQKQRLVIKIKPQPCRQRAAIPGAAPRSGADGAPGL